MDELKASPVVNPKAMLLAKALRAMKEFGNKAQIPEGVPLVGGQGAGDLVLGKAPEEVENWGYGNYPFQIPEMSNIPNMKTGRAEGVFDAMSMAPVGVGGAGQAAITAAGDPRLILSRATYDSALRRALSGKGGDTGMKHPSFAIQKEGLPEDFGSHFVLPHPRALNPKNNPNSELFNVDAYTGYPVEGRKDTRLLFEDSPSEDYALRIGVSPKFNSFEHFESSPWGAATLRDSGTMGLGNDAAVNAVIKKLDQVDPDWYDNIIERPQPLKDLAGRDREVALLVKKLRRASGIGQEHAELKHTARFPLSDSTTQHILVPEDRLTNPNDTFSELAKAIRSRGIPVSGYADSWDATQKAMDIQKKAKF
jgi:hypothetical protein